MCVVKVYVCVCLSILLLLTSADEREELRLGLGVDSLVKLSQSRFSGEAESDFLVNNQILIIVIRHKSISPAGSDSGEQPDQQHPCQGPGPTGQAAAPLPVQEPAEGAAGQHAQEPAGAADP